jgi:hypothetical protein
MSALFFGGCDCGAIRYSAEGEPLFSMNCHCRHCQRETGSAYAAVLAVPSTTFRIVQGKPKHFEVTADSGHTTTRVFCVDCGSPLFGLPGITPDMVTIRVGSLDDPSVFRPAQDIYTASAQPWDYMNPDLPKTPKLPNG